MNFFYSSFNEIFGEKPLEYFILGKQDGGAILIQLFQRNTSFQHCCDSLFRILTALFQHRSNFVPIMLPCNQASLQIVSCNIAQKFQSSTIPLQKKNAWRVCFQQKHFCKRDPYILRLVSGDTYLLLWPRMCALTKYFSNKNHFWKLFKHDQ